MALPQHQPTPTAPQLVIGSEILNTASVAHKVRQDIRFLEDRLERLSAQHNPNPRVVKVYQDMLDGRRAILDWLENSQTPRRH